MPAQLVFHLFTGLTVWEHTYEIGALVGRYQSSDKRPRIGRDDEDPLYTKEVSY